MYAFCFFTRGGRHTRFKCDWSSDVCSSDLMAEPPANKSATPGRPRRCALVRRRLGHLVLGRLGLFLAAVLGRRLLFVQARRPAQPLHVAPAQEPAPGHGPPGGPRGVVLPAPPLPVPPPPPPPLTPPAPH